MKGLLTIGLASIATYGVGTAAASAQNLSFYCRYYGWYCNTDTPTTSVPEIDASSGLLAMAAVAAMLLLT